MASIKFAMLVPLKGSNGSIFCGCCPQNLVYSHLHPYLLISSLNMVQNSLIVSKSNCKPCESVLWVLFMEFYIEMARRSRRCVRSRRPMVLWACSEFKPSISLDLVVVFTYFVTSWIKNFLFFIGQPIWPDYSGRIYLFSRPASTLHGTSSCFGSDHTYTKCIIDIILNLWIKR